MSTPHRRPDQWRDAATATGSSLPGPPSPGAILGSFVALIDHLIAAQTQLISSYLRLGSSVARHTPPAITTGRPRRQDEPALAGKQSGPAPALPTDLIAARAHEIYVRRGRGPGDPVDDWRRAEAELRAEMTG